MRVIAPFIVAIALVFIVVDVCAEREISMSVQDKQVEWESKLEGPPPPGTCPPGEDDCEGPEGAAKFRLKADGELAVEFEFASNSGTVETETKIKFEPEAIIEFVDTNGDGKLSPGEWRHNTTLKDAGWNNIACVTPSPSASVQSYKCDVTHTTLDLTFSFSVSNIAVPLNISGTSPVKPSSMKIDMALRNFPYQVTGQASRLAVLTKSVAKSSQEVNEDDSGSTEAELKFGSVGMFSWVKVANNGNATMPVLTSPLETAGSVGDDSEYRMFFAFGADNPSEIVWDPELGAGANPGGSTTSSAASLAPSFLALVAAAFLAVVLI